MLPLFSKTYLINLAHRTDRLERVLPRLSVQGFSVNLFPAIKPDTVNGFPSIGLYGCFLSHRAIIKRSIQEDLDTVLIFEDDVILRDDTSNKLKLIQKELSGVEWDILFLGCYVGSINYYTPITQHLNLVSHCSETHAYVVSRKGMLFLDHWFNKLLEREFKPSHDAFIGGLQEGVKLVSNPILAVQDNSFSNCTDRPSYNKYPIDFTKHCKELR